MKMFRGFATKIHFILFMVFFLLFSGMPVDARALQKPAPPLWPHEKSQLAPDPALKFGKFPNGLRYVLMKNTTPKNRVSMHLDIQSGSIHETDDQQGLAHYLEHMMFNGSTHFKPGELIKYFQSIGMDFGNDANGHTGYSETVYDIVLPDGSEKSIQDGLLVFRDYAGGALLLPEEIEREKGIILAEKRARDSVSYRTYVETLKFELPETILPKRLPIGEEEDIKNADRQLLKDYYDTWYRPDNMILVMVGDFDFETAEKGIEEKFADFTARAPERSPHPFGSINHKGLKPFYHYEKEAGNTEVMIEVMSKTEPTPDSLELQKQQLVQGIADMMVYNRLNTLLSDPETPFTSAVIGSGVFLQYIQYAYISADCNPDKWEDSLKRIEQTLRQALTYGFTSAELERVQSDYLSDLENNVKEAATRESQELSRELVMHLNDDKVFMSPDQELDIFGPIVKSLTLEQVHKALKTGWAPDHRLILVTGNAEIDAGGTSPEAKILTVFENSRKQEVQRPAEKAKIVFPYLPEPEKNGKITSRRESTDIGVIQIDFENGVRLNLKKTGFEDNVIEFKVLFGTGRFSEPPELSGLSYLSEEVIDESGVGKLTRDDLEKALAGKKTKVQFKVEEDAFSFKGETTPEETRLAFQLLQAYLTDLTVRENAYRLSMKRFEQKYDALSSSIEGAMILQGDRFLAGGDSRFGLPPFESFKKLTIADIRNWIEPALNKNRLELSVVGDFSIDEVIDYTATYLGALPPRTRLAVIENPGKIDFPEGKNLNIEVGTQIPKGLTVVAYPTDNLWDISKTRRLSILGDIMQNRLLETIREKLGATYSPYCFNWPTRAYEDYGLIKTYIIADPKLTATIVDETKKIAQSIAENGVTSDELRRSIDPQLTGIKDMRRKNRYWLNTVLADSVRHPEQLGWSRTIVSDYDAITVQDVETLARQYLKNEKAASVVVTPAAPASND